MRRRFSLSAVTGGAPTAPLLILFGLNLVDEFDRAAFSILTPEIRDAFGLNTQGILTVVGLVSIVALGGQVFIGYYADRFSRVQLACVGAAAWALFTLGTGLAPGIVVLVIFRSLTGVGKAVNGPTHNSLLADLYDTSVRTQVYGFHQSANGLGLILGSLLAGVLAYFFGWRAPFLVLWIPTAVIVGIAFARLHEPVRGVHERRVLGASEEAATTEEHSPSFAEAWRICHQVKTLRRIWTAMPFVAAGLFGIGSLTSIYYRDVFHVTEFHRGIIAAITEPAQLLGIIVGIPLATRLSRRDPGLVLKFLAVAATISAVALVGFARAPNLVTAVVMNMVASSVLGLLSPGILSVLSLAIPPRARATGFSIGSLYLLPGVLILGIIGGIADDAGIRNALLVLVPVFLGGAIILATSGRFVASDINKVRASTLAQAEVLAARRRGEVKLLLVKEIDVGYDGAQVLFGVDFEVDEGEIIALLGTNGAGKSTLLKAISGLLEPTAGAIVFDGRDSTYAPAHELAARGIVQMPGRGVFPSLSVQENLSLAAWLHRRDSTYVREEIARALEMFPALGDRLHDSAGTLSGGQQQMLALGMTFLSKPRLVMIDELSLGLAPVIVEELIGALKRMRDEGMTVILVEQSVNVALTIADRAYYLEKGEIRFEGPTEELLARPDILRSVFIKGATAVTGNGNAVATKTPARTAAKATPLGVPVLEVSGLVKSFGGVSVLNDVTFDLRQGQILGVVGPNGAGKTTMFDLVSGFVPLDGGKVVLNGDDVTDLAPDIRARMGLGRSFQDARLFPTLTVADTVALACERAIAVRDPLAAALNLPGVARSERAVARRVAELVELLGLGAFRDKFIAELSTGSRRIVDLACIMAHSPSVLLLDEPSSGIAQRESEALGDLMKRIQREVGASLVVIEHDIPLISSVSDELIAMHLGRVFLRGTPDAVLSDPTVIEAYLGSHDDIIQRSGARAGGSTARRARRLSRSGK